jgi:predicted RNA binding protein YcfA (HicA-like mRNA interferase family)
MSKRQKLLRQIFNNLQNVSFKDMVSLVEAFGFTFSHVNGNYHIYTHPEIAKLVNLQSVKGKAKAYQVKQFLELVETYNLKLED